MNTVEKMTVRLALGAVVFGCVTAAGPAGAFTVDPEALKLVDELVLDMKNKSMSELYPAMPLKDQMRGKMMIERTSKNYLQDVIQPQVMGKNVEDLKKKLMEGRLDN